MGRDEHDRDYYRRREARERDLAAKAVDPAIQRIHLELADQYADRARDAARSGHSVRLVARA